MDTMAQLQEIEQITLTSFVRQALGSNSIILVDWHVAPYGGGAGRNVYRFMGNATDQGNVVPWSLVLKVTSEPPGVTDPAYLHRHFGEVKKVDG